MKILVLGAAGMIGHRVFIELKKNWPESTFGSIRRAKSHYAQYGLFNQNIFENIDVLNWKKTEDLLNELKPNFIINAVGITIRKEEIKNINTTLEINSFLPHRLLKWAQRNNSKIIHLSTDCVFSGESGKYDETSNPTATDTYGKTKFLGEITDHQGLTLRFSAIGRELDSHTELLDWFLSQSGTVKGFRNAIYTGVTTHVVANEIVNIIKNHQGLNGIFQLSSSPISKYDLLHLIKEKFKSETQIIPFDEYVSDKSLICKKYSDQTDFKSPDWSDMLDKLVNDREINYV